MGKRVSSRLVKKHRTYTYEEAGEVVGVTSATVRSWRKQGLRVMTACKPHYILGADLIDYLDAKQRKRSAKPSLGTFPCFTCQTRRTPLGAMVDYIPSNDAMGQLMGLCAVCERPLYQFASLRNLHRFDGIFEIAIKKAS